MLNSFKTLPRNSICIVFGMTKKLFLSIAVAALSVSPMHAQSSPISGVWEANFNGTVFLTIRLSAGESIAGFISVGSIGVDYEGNLLAAEAATPENESPIIHASLEGQTLKFEIDDEGEITRLEITLTGDGKAVIKFPDLAEKIKPIVLERKKPDRNSSRSAPVAPPDFRGIAVAAGIGISARSPIVPPVLLLLPGRSGARSTTTSPQNFFG